jgi:hypothetical protein
MKSIYKKDILPLTCKHDNLFLHVQHFSWPAKGITMPTMSSTERQTPPSSPIQKISGTAY